MTLSTADLNGLKKAANRMIQGSALELPFDADVAQILGRHATAIGFTDGVGTFEQAVKLRPVSTMILFVAFVGGSGAALPRP